MKTQKGISLIALIVTIIIIIILAVIATRSGLETITESNISKTYNEAYAVQNAIKEARILLQINPTEYSKTYFFGKPVSELDQSIAGSNIGRYV